MNSSSEDRRLQSKTPEQKFLQVLEHDYRQAPKLAEAILVEAQDCLQGRADQVQPGQIRILLAKESAPVGRPLSETELQEVIWTVDAGSEDRAVLRQQGRVALRQVRICRLLEEALEQGAVATQEDLARALNTSCRTIKRDWAALGAKNLALPSRGHLKKVGRNQTHKAQILELWLQGKTYDQIALETRHTSAAIRRYVLGFVQVIRLERLGFAPEEIARLLVCSLSLVQQYRSISTQFQTPASQERLESQLQRFAQAVPGPKGGA